MTVLSELGVCGRNYIRKTLEKSLKSSSNKTLTDVHHHHKIKALHVPYARTPEINTDHRLIRNIGVVAHIDSGKTTVTERMLHLGGAIRSVGAVDSGTTVTDFMQEERQRGITIQSAAITFYYKQHRINLIDTPGHVDFTIEVERCLRVLDGTVTVIDGSAGVQAQTLTVWKQANKFALPSVIFINKLDRQASSFDGSLSSIENKLKVVPLCLYIPRVTTDRDGNRQIKLLDLGRMKYNGENGTLVEGMESWDELMLYREELFDRLADLDDPFAQTLLAAPSSTQISFEQHVKPAVRRATLCQKAAAVSGGSALTGLGVDTVLDMVTQYLPAPSERSHHFIDCYQNDLCALVFKIMHNSRHGQLTFVRLYSGRIHNGMSLFNASREVNEANVKVYLPHSDELQHIDHVEAGNISVLTGLQKTVTGDTLVKDANSAKQAAQRHSELLKAAKKHHIQHFPESTANVKEESCISGKLVLAGIDIPEPVYFCSIEAPSLSELHKLEMALNQLAIEDPSMRFRKDEQQQQTVLQGNGQLHIEIIKERLLNEFGLKVFMGPLQINYRECVENTAEHSSTLTDTVNGMNQSIQLTMSIHPSPGSGLFKTVDVRLNSENAYNFVRRDWLSAIEDGCRNALSNGPILAFPVHDTKVTLTYMASSGGRLNTALIAACAGDCITNALAKTLIHVLEPIVLLEVSVSTGEQRLQPLLDELSRRHAEVVSIDRQDLSLVTVIARLPLADTVNLSSIIRKLTSGMASVHIEQQGYGRVTDQRLNHLLNRVRTGHLI